MKMVRFIFFKFEYFDKNNAKFQNTVNNVNWIIVPSTIMNVVSSVFYGNFI